ncbi:transcription initiation factor IID, 18kD subunit-domain-containing protein [Daedaleopsis nitida]|nr:transcription initiation factor IID, 18kD subunit-domain-containing protein [Daedaleopsis nitida]
MSHYPQYTAGTTYPYAGYHPQTAATYAHPQGSAAYPTAQYQPYAPPTAVTSYGTWPYHGYTYYPQQQQQAAHAQVATAQKPATATTSTAQTATVPAPITATPAVAPSSVTARTAVPSTYTFASYNRDPNLYGRSGRKGSSYRGLFTKELRNLMYGFGDDRNPANDTVNVMEEILIEYIVDVVQTASGGGKKSRLSIEDLRRALSRPADAKKLARMEELLFMQEDIKRARAEFDERDIHPAGSSM